MTKVLSMSFLLHHTQYEKGVYSKSRFNKINHFKFFFKNISRESDLSFSVCVCGGEEGKTISGFSAFLIVLGLQQFYLHY